MFWVLILFFRDFFKTLKKFFGRNTEIITQLYQCSKGNIAFSLFNPSYVNISFMKTLELGQVFCNRSSFVLAASQHSKTVLSFSGFNDTKVSGRKN